MRHSIPIAVLLVGLLPACGGDDPSGTGGGGAGAGSGVGGVGGAGGGGTTSTGTAGGAPPSCGDFQAGDDFLACAATYTTGDGDDQVGAVDVAPDGTVVVAGAVAPGDLGAPAISLLDGGAAGLLRLSADGRAALGVTRLGASATDVAVRRTTGDIAVSGSFGVAVLDPTAQEIRWSDAAPGDASEVAFGDGGTVAVLAGTQVTVYDEAGAQLGSFSVATNREVSDLAVDDTTQSIFATGFKQDDGPPCTQLQIPFLRAYGFDGTLRWRAYDWNKDQVGAADECADSRGHGLAMGHDGKLYYAGESHGGNSVHRRLPQDLSQMAPTVKFDEYNDPYDLNGAAPIGFYARFDPATGAIEAGQSICTRLGDGKGNAARPRAIAADAAGNMLITGATACCIEGADVKTVNGQPAMPGYAGGGFALVVSSDFQQRLAWTAFNGEVGSGAGGVSVAMGPTSAALLMRQAVNPSNNESTTEIPLITVNAVQAAPGGGPSDGYLVVFPAP